MQKVDGWGFYGLLKAITNIAAKVWRCILKCLLQQNVAQYGFPEEEKMEMKIAKGNSCSVKLHKIIKNKKISI